MPLICYGTCHYHLHLGVTLNEVTRWHEGTYDLHEELSHANVFGF